MAKGYVYVLKNPAHRDNHFKIGKTTRTVLERIKELSHGTGVPKPYEEAYSMLFDDCDVAEKQIHKLLTVYRQGNDREFFEVDLWIVIRELTTLKIAELEIYFKENLDRKEEEIAILQKQLVISKRDLDKKDKEIVVLQKELVTYKQNINVISKPEVNTSANVSVSVLKRIRDMVIILRIGDITTADDKNIEDIESLLTLLELDFTDNEIIQVIERLLDTLELSDTDMKIVGKIRKLLMYFRDDLKDFIQVLFSNSNNIARNTLVYLSKNYTKEGLRAKTLTKESIYKNISPIIAIELLAIFNVVTYQKLKDKYNVSVFEWENDINEHKKFYFRVIIDICLDMNFIKGFAGGEKRFLLTKDGFNSLRNTKIELNYEIEYIMILYLESFQRNNDIKDEANSYY